jgi:hypothetical protein
VDGTVPARDLLGALLDAARPHADALGCRSELEGAPALAADPGFGRQLDVAAGEGGSLERMVAELARRFTPGA